MSEEMLYFLEERFRLHSNRILGLELIKKRHEEEEIMLAYSRGARDELVITLKYMGVYPKTVEKIIDGRL
jgi:hypothetical protein